NTKVRLKGIVYRPDQLLMDEVGKVKVQRTRFSFHSSKLTDEEIDALLTEYFTTCDFVQRKSFQLLCGMTQSTASRHLRHLCEEGKLKNVGLPKQPVYKPVDGHYIVNE
ncbi:MAG: DNA-binding protein, partial [Prevotella sp.]|nr:DNA-binding protein [Prevotella sp.]